MNTLLIVVSSIAISGTLIVDGKVNFQNGDCATVGCLQFPLEIRLPLVGPVETALKGLVPDEIELSVGPVTQSRPYPVFTRGLDHMLSITISMIFAEFFEQYRPWLEDNISKDPTNWPAIWDFARVVRNSAAHGGAIYFRNANARPVQWHQLSYNPTHNGRTVLFQDLSIGDFLLLMFEMNDALDQLQCPT